MYVRHKFCKMHCDRFKKSMSLDKILASLDKQLKLGESLFGSILPIKDADTMKPPIDIEYRQLTDPAFAASYENVQSILLRQVNFCANLNDLISKRCHSSNQPGTSLQNTSNFKELEESVYSCTICPSVEGLVEFLHTNMLDILDSIYEKFDSFKDKAKLNMLRPNDGPRSVTAPIVMKDKVLGVIQAKNIVRPQLKFLEKINNSNAPFSCKLKEKLHARKPYSGAGHPYEFEIKNIEYSSKQLAFSGAVKPMPIEQQPFLWIDTPDALADLIASLTRSSVEELAVDLEHHNYRSFLGFTCLMQISTRSSDYLIDTLALRSHMQTLNVLFTDPKIVKVFHGSEHDIEWLQKDFGIFVVNLFDTYAASKVLQLESNSLAFLLEKFVAVKLDKKHQLSDWRLRPLPDEMARYAQADTHYLLYLYDLLKEQLVKKDSTESFSTETDDENSSKFIKLVLKKSNEYALLTYEKPLYDTEESWKVTFYKQSKPLTPDQQNVFKALHEWRDQVARDEDESLAYVLPTHLLFVLSSRMPIEGKKVVECCGPHVPPLIRQHADELGMMIFNVKRKSINDQGSSTPVQLDEEDSLSRSVPSQAPSVLMQAMSSMPAEALPQDREDILKLVKSNFIGKFLEKNRDYVQELKKGRDLHVPAKKAKVEVISKQDDSVEVLDMPASRDDKPGDADTAPRAKMNLDEILKPGILQDPRFISAEKSSKKANAGDQEFVPFDYQKAIKEKNDGVASDSSSSVTTTPSFQPYASIQSKKFKQTQKHVQSTSPQRSAASMQSGAKSMTFKPTPRKSVDK